MNTFKLTYLQATDMLASMMKRVKEDLDVEHVLVVPEVYVFAFERLLISQCKGSFSIVVKSVSRMFSQLLSEEKVITKYEAMTLIKKIAFENKDELTCFKSSYKKSGFAKKMYETISRMQDQSVSPSDMQANSMRKNKIDDVRLIYSKYLEAISGKMVDSNGRVKRLAQYFDELSEKENKHYYFINFDLYTPAMQALIKAIDQKALSVTVYEPSRAQTKTMASDIKVYKAQDDFDQLKEVVRRISQDHVNGLSYDDMIVAGEGLDYERTKRIFDDYNIPFYLDKRTTLSSHPICAFIENAINASLKNLKKEDVLALSKSPYLEGTKKQKDDFDTYVSSFLVNFGGFLSEFDKKSEYTKNAEIIRKRVVSVISKVKLKSKTCIGANVHNTVKNLLSLIKAEDDLEQRIVEGIESCCACISSVFSSEQNTDFLSEALFDLFESVEFSTLQKTRGCVQIGPLNDFRGQAFKKVYLINFNEGVLPKNNPDCELLSDGDIKEMEECSSLNLSCKISDLNARYKDELWQLLQTCGELFISYVEGGKGKPSMQLQKIIDDEHLVEVKFKEKDGKKVLVKIVEKNGKMIEDENITKDDKLAIYSSEYVVGLLENANKADFVSLIATADNAIEQYYLSPTLKYKSEIYYALKDRFDKINHVKNFVIDPKYTKVEKVSASAIKEYYSCPFKYFCKYVLSLKELEDGTVNALDVGNILHEVIATYLDKTEKEPIEKVVGEIFDTVIQNYPHALIEQNASVVSRLKTESVVFCSVAARQVGGPAYQLVDSEMSFGKNKKGEVLSTIAFDSQKNAVMVGSIDRVDSNANNGMARVVDYKTGSNKQLSIDAIYDGSEVQLPLYATILKENGYDIGGMFFSPLISAWKGVDKVNKFNGYFENSDANTVAIESTVAIDKKNGYTKEEIENLCAYTVRLSAKAIENVEKGQLNPLPLDKERSTSCDYCPYFSICGHDVKVDAKRSKKGEKLVKNYILEGRGNTEEKPYKVVVKQRQEQSLDGNSEELVNEITGENVEEVGEENTNVKSKT